MNANEPNLPPQPHDSQAAALDAGLAEAFSPDRTGAYRENKEPVAGTILAGKYRLSEPIGEGGMGSVWVAHQSEPVKRKVAIKLIKAGMDSKQVLARFDAERQALAMMDHPNIAKVLDGGVHDGRPFFVMELVKGTPITRFCDARKLTPKERLELFIPVCNAIQHAHQKGIIHRDIKPSNVLIALYDDRPVPKVIDFGVAKATGGALTEHTIETNFGGVVGTPQYMSPEQAMLNNLDIDTRSDVYALGVLLYELLTGSPPFSQKDLEKKGLFEILRVVREEEPPRPSHRLSTADALASLSANRGTEPKKLTGLLRNELDWIVMKSLEKDRTRRYETVNGFAMDVSRYLAGEPVLAHPPSVVYRFRKFVRRNRPALLAGGMIAASLILGIGLSVYQAVRADREARRVVAVLDELRESAPAFAEQARVLAARERFDEAIEKFDYAARLRPDLADYPLAKADLLRCQLRFAEAAAAYRVAISVKPGDERAAAAALLCDELRAALGGADGRPDRESLGKLYTAMQREQRPAAELMPVARKLGEEKNHIVALWLERLKDLPVSGERPLAARLNARDDGRLTLDLGETKISDLAPLAEAPIAELLLGGATEVKDLGPITGLRLQSLDIGGTMVADLGPLEGMKTLERLVLNRAQVKNLEPVRMLPLKRLSLRETRVTDLSPLAAMPLKSLDLTLTPVTDFTPLAGLPLEMLSIQHTKLANLDVVRRMPLKELALWGCVDARNYEALTGLKTLELLLLPHNYRDLPLADIEAIGRLRTLPKLRQLGAHITDKLLLGATTGASETFWKEWDEHEMRFGPLRRAGIKFALSPLPDGYHLSIENQTSVKDLTSLAGLTGLPIRELWLNDCRVTDLTPIRDLPLRALGLFNNPVTDLSPIQGMPLDELSLEYTAVSDLTPILGCKLRKLYLHGCVNVTDVAAVAGIQTLQLVTVPPHTQNINLLQSLPKLTHIGFDMQGAPPFLPVTTSEEFWGSYDASTPLRGNATKLNIIRGLPDGTRGVDLVGTSVKDLSILNGLAISELWAGDTEIVDLTPLRGMNIRRLQLYRTKVSDLKALQGMPIESLNLVATPVTDLSPLAGMPLKELKLNLCKSLTDLSPLKECPTIKWLTIPHSAKNIEFLRELPNLELLSYEEDERRGWRPTQTVAEFWADFDSKQSGP